MKNGTIRLQADVLEWREKMERKIIHFYLDTEHLDNDVRSLLMAFYPGADITRQFDRQLFVQADLSAAVTLTPGKERTGTLSVELINSGEVFVRQGEVKDRENRKETRTVCKCLLYRMLVQCNGRELPWGTLTGIRPTKIPRTMLMEGKSEADAVRYMEEEMLCSPEKTALSIEIAKREIGLLNRLDYEDGYSLYIGIPFCPTTCAYCSFTSYPLSRFAGKVEAYLDALEKEIAFTAKHFREKKLNTVYIGGGTPTTLSPAQLDRLLAEVEKNFDLTWLQEWTVEAGRPDSITEEKLRVIHSHPVTRISINPQTMKQETLDLIGRKHTVEQIRDTFRMAREAGFDNINMDMIVGLPDETPDDVEHTLCEIRALAPDSLTVHSLAIKRAARMNTQKESFAQSKSVNTVGLMDLTREYAGRMGMVPYYLYRQKNMTGNLENVGYAAAGKECIYNILIMEEVQTIVALGAGAITKAVFGERIERCENVKDIKTYLEKTDEMIDRKRKLFGF